MERKKRYLVGHVGSMPFRRLCSLLRISHQTGYDWLARFRKNGLEELVEDDPGGRPRKEIPEDVRQAVLGLRKEHGWNEKAIREELLHRRVEASFYSIRTVLAEANALGVAPPRKKRSYGTFERPWPNHLWQADFTLLDDETWLFALEDDYSRYLVDAMEFEEASTENALFVLRRATTRHGVPYQLLTDHGTQFYDNTGKKPNAFGEIVTTWGVEHILAGVKRPQTCGKIERWFRTYKENIPRFKDLASYLYYYNYDRPHGGIYYRKPYERYYAYRL